MSVPSELIGAWRRSGLIIDGFRRVDYCDALWLQSDNWYADIRLVMATREPVPTGGVAGRFAKERAFAGVANWSPPLMTWEHVFDSRTNPPADCNALRWERGVVVERGKQSWDGREIPWEEEWLRMTDEETQPAVTATDRYVHIVVGHWSIEVKDERPDGPFVCTRSDRIEGDWREVGSVRV